MALYNIGLMVGNFWDGPWYTYEDGFYGPISIEDTLWLYSQA